MDLDKSQLSTPSSHDGSDSYCREIEAYLCRKNDGHLIRIVGPAFEHVRGWTERGIPLKVAFRGIDRYFERYYAKGPRRRPVRVEFCEADVLDVFDDWRRAVGVAGIANASDHEADAGSSRRHGGLPSHLERAIARLTALRAGEDRRLDEVIDAIVRELDAARLGARALRGEARERFLQRLRELDAALVDAARGHCDAGALAQIVAEAGEELSPFRERMPGEAYERSRQACIDRLVRERSKLPTLVFE